MRQNFTRIHKQPGQAAGLFIWENCFGSGQDTWLNKLYKGFLLRF